MYTVFIFCFGLMTDVNEKLFPASKHLIEVGAKLHNIASSCQNIGCTNLATNHLRYRKDGMLIKNGSSVSIDDGKQIYYKSVCRKCYDEAMQKKR